MEQNLQRSFGRKTETDPIILYKYRIMNVEMEAGKFLQKKSLKPQAKYNQSFKTFINSPILKFFCLSVEKKHFYQF